MAGAGGEIAAVDGIDVAQLPGCQAGVLVADRKIAGDIDVNDRIARVEIGLEEIRILAHVNGRGLRQNAGFVHKGEDLLRCDVDAVVMEVVTQGDTQGDCGNIVLFIELRREIAGGVAGDFDFLHR